MDTMNHMKYILTFILLLAGIWVSARDETEQKEPIEPVMELMYLKSSDGKIHLKATLVDYVNRRPVPLQGLEVVFTMGIDPEIELGRLNTDVNGRAELAINEDTSRPGYEEGELRFCATYEGSKEIMFSEAEVYISPVTLEMNLEMIDSVGYVNLRAYTLSEGEEVPVADEDIYVYVKRMFSDLPIGEDFLDENGEYEVEVPMDIPGDADGDIEIIARFDDHYLFGTVEKRELVKWGIPTKHKIPESQRALWTQIAPMWMIITLSILLLGVWGHYTYVIVTLFRIRRESRKEKAVSTSP
jgi:hypothetical protein